MPFAEVGRFGEKQTAGKEGGKKLVFMPVVWIRNVFGFHTSEAALVRKKDQ